MKGGSKCDVRYVIYNLIWFIKAGGINLVLKQLILTLFSSIFMGAVCFQSWNMTVTAATATYVLIIVCIGLSTRPKNSKTPHFLSCQAPLRSPYFLGSPVSWGWSNIIRVCYLTEIFLYCKSGKLFWYNWEHFYFYLFK